MRDYLAKQEILEDRETNIKALRKRIRHRSYWGILPNFMHRSES